MPALHGSGRVLRMNHRLPSWPFGFLVAQSRIVVPPAIEIIRGPVGRVRPDNLRNVIRDRAQPFFALAHGEFGLFSLGDDVGRSDHGLHFTVHAAQRAEDVLVVAFHSIRACVGRFIADKLPGLEHLLDLLLQLRRQTGKLVQLDEILPDRFFQLQTPQIEQRLVSEDETALPVEKISEVGNG